MRQKQKGTGTGARILKMHKKSIFITKTRRNNK